MNRHQQKLMSYFDKQIASCNQRSKLLAADERIDEGNIEKIRANVYGIFKTVLSAGEKNYGNDDLAIQQFFLQKTEQIPENWTSAYQKAKQHGDTEQMHIESIKLGTLQEIKDTFLQILEETT